MIASSRKIDKFVEYEFEVIIFSIDLLIFSAVRGKLEINSDEG